MVILNDTQGGTQGGTQDEIDDWIVEQIYAGEETRARNQRLQNMFRMIGFGENLGSGFPLILSAWNEKHWLKPELIEQRDLMQVKLVLSIETKEVGKDDVKDVVKELPNVLKNGRDCWWYRAWLRWCTGRR